MKTLIFGCGYLGRRVAARWIAAGHEVFAVTRSAARGDDFRAAGIVPVIGDVAERASVDGLPEADVALYAVGFDRAGGRDRRTVVVDGIRNALDATAGKVARIVFVSTTSVYGQRDEEWVDEESVTEPESEGGRFALEAENTVRDAGTESVILRMSGLYGPGRLLRRVEQMRDGEPIAGDGNAWLNLVHVDDAASAVVLAADHSLRPSQDWPRAAPSATFLVSDDRPARRREYYGRLAELTGSPPAVFDPSKEGRSAGMGKRCRNRRAKEQLGLVLRYPTFEEGLREAVEAR